MAHIVGIAIRSAKRAPMYEITSTEISLKNGLESDSRGGGGFRRRRQVTVLSAQQWEETCRELGILLIWHMRRANLCIDGLRFGPESVGKTLSLGTVELEITGETRPCERMDEACPGLKDALSKDWRGGVTCRVRKEGLVAIHSPVSIVQT